MSDIRYSYAESGPALEKIRDLFVAYAKSLNFSLCFQGFDKELAELPGLYASPRGRLMLCEVDGQPAGCVALKPLSSTVCEMKRLFVRPEFRGKQIGVQLARRIIHEAHDIGYEAMRLDTLRGPMGAAIAIYKSLGFREIAPYYHNPIADAVYMELLLKREGK